MSDYTEVSMKTIGDFWLPAPGEEPEARGGFLTLDDEVVEVVVSQSLTPMHIRESIGENAWSMKANTNNFDLTIIGKVPTRPVRVTLWGANSIKQNEVGLPLPGLPDSAGSQTFRATTALIGSHIEDRDHPFTRISADITNLAEWAHLPSVSMQWAEENSRVVSFVPDMPEKVETPLRTGGELVLQPTARHGFPEIRGVRITTSTLANFSPAQPDTLGQLRRNLVDPMADLLSLLAGTRCQVRALTLSDAERSEIRVRGFGVVPSAPETAGKLWLGRLDMGMPAVAGWLELHPRVSPCPQIVAAAWSNDFPSVDVEVLILATAIEGLFDSLYPDERRFTRAELRQAGRAIAKLGLSDELMKSISGAGSWWGKVSFPGRVVRLATDIQHVAPDVTGEITVLKKRIAEARNLLAHGGGAKLDNDDDVIDLAALADLMKWLLTIRLLLEAGVPQDTLKERLQGSDSFRRDREFWTGRLPDVFPNGIVPPPLPAADPGEPKSVDAAASAELQDAATELVMEQAELLSDLMQEDDQ